MKLKKLTIENIASIEHAEIDFSASPLKDADPQTVAAMRALCSELVEEPTTRGFRLKFIL